MGTSRIRPRTVFSNPVLRRTIQGEHWASLTDNLCAILNKILQQVDEACSKYYIEDEEKQREIKALKTKWCCRDEASADKVTCDDMIRILGDLRNVSFADSRYELNGLNRWVIGLHEFTPSTYCSMVCKYVNRLKRATVTSLHSNVSDDGRKKRQRLDSESAVPVSPGVSCATLPLESFRELRDLEGDVKNRRIHELLIDHNVISDEHTLADLDYFFITYFSPTHHILLGVAPKQQYIFAIDSFGRFNNYSIDQWPLKGLYDIILAEFPDDAQTEWQIFGEWSRRRQTTDKSPDIVQQRDSFNCGVFTSMNMMCLAFGYELLSYVNADPDEVMENMIRYKRPRMAIELYLGELGSEEGLKYDLIEYPTELMKGVSREQSREQSPVVDEEGTYVPPLSQWEGIGHGPGDWGPGGPVLGRENIEATTGGEWDEEAAIEQVEDEVDIRSDFGAPQWGFHVDSEGWPMQFSAEHFQRAGFLYKISEKETEFWDSLKTIDELQGACEAREMRNYSRFCIKREIRSKTVIEGKGKGAKRRRDDGYRTKSKEPVYETFTEEEIRVFRRWCKNYCAASKAIIEAEEAEKKLLGSGIFPFPDLGRRETAKYVL